MRFKKLFSWVLLLLLAQLAKAQIIKPLVIADLSHYTAAKALNDISLSDVPAPQRLTDVVINCSCTSGCDIVLPVKLLSFDGERTDKTTVLLHWKTTNEIMNKGFDVERALGDATVFEKVSFVPSQESYSFQKKYKLQDFNDYSGISYYRLKQIDIDGKFVYSKIVEVKGYATEPTIQLYPNPVRDKLFAKLYFPQNCKVNLVIYDASEKQILSQQVSITSGFNMVPVKVNFLSNGYYLVKVISDNNDVLTAKFIK